MLVVFLAAIFCNVAGVRRYQQMNLRLLQTGDTQAFLRELSACEKAANRNTRNTIFIAKAYAYLLEGRYDAASALLTGLDLASCRQPRARQNDRCAYSVRCAGLAINCDQYQAAEQHLAALRREVAALRPTDALHVHYAKMLQDLSQMLAVRRGEAGGHAEYFRNQLEMAGDTVGRAARPTIWPAPCCWRRARRNRRWNTSTTPRPLCPGWRWGGTPPCGPQPARDTARLSLSARGGPKEHPAALRGKRAGLTGCGNRTCKIHPAGRSLRAAGPKKERGDPVGIALSFFIRFS